MSDWPAHEGPGSPRGLRPYRSLPLVALIERIGETSDRLALDELHTYRPVFETSDGKRLLFHEFVAHLRRTAWAARLADDNASVLRDAADLTTYRFTMIPKPPPSPQPDPAEPDASPPETASGVPEIDCRNTYRGFLASWREAAPGWTNLPPLEQNAMAERLLRNLVLQHFRWCCQEVAGHVDPTRSSYEWELGEGIIKVYFPKWFAGPKRKTWLEDNVPDPDPNRHGERERVQAIIDAYFPVARVGPLPPDDAGPSIDQTPESIMNAASEPQASRMPLAVMLADEKVKNITRLRPTIQNLGPGRLRQLIFRIIDAILARDYHPGLIAAEFGIPASKLSLFAARDWKGEIPDLWRNLAQLVSRQPEFMDSAEGAGVWRVIEEIVAKRKRRGEEDPGHGR